MLFDFWVDYPFNMMSEEWAVLQRDPRTDLRSHCVGKVGTCERSDLRCILNASRARVHTWTRSAETDVNIRCRREESRANLTLIKKKLFAFTVSFKADA